MIGGLQDHWCRPPPLQVAEGGILEYLKIDPLDSKDKAPKWRLTGQTSGVRYAYNDGTFDDSA